jgi:capsular polysaccharide biosynthesis protein
MARIAPVLEALDTSGAPARLYLARKPTQVRRLANAEATEARLVAAGFETRDFAELPFAEQLRLVRGAEWIVGPAGSAMENIVFGRPGLRVGVLVPRGPEDLSWLTQRCRPLGIELTAIVGEIVEEHARYRWMSDYRIDATVLETYLATASPGDFEGGGETSPDGENGRPGV